MLGSVAIAIQDAHGPALRSLAGRGDGAVTALAPDLVLGGGSAEAPLCRGQQAANARHAAAVQRTAA